MVQMTFQTSLVEDIEDFTFVNIIITLWFLNDSKLSLLNFSPYKDY